MVPARDYYRTYHGHDVEFLERVLEVLRSRHEGIIYLAGDSSLDNKYWVHTQKKAVNGYEEVLEPSSMKADVCYWLNEQIVQSGPMPMAGCGAGPSLAALNTAIEATTLGQRVGGWFSHTLLTQDRFIRDHISERDYLIVSVGGNDIALAPTLTTVASILALVYTASDAAIQSGNAWGMGHFIRMFRDQIRRYVELLVEMHRPRKVLICMIYYPDVEGAGSWADFALSALSYNSNPRRLQAAIAAVFDHAVSQIRIDGTEVVPIPLFRVLNGTDTRDYVDRVEPSAQGGQKMAKALLERILGAR